MVFSAAVSNRLTEFGVSVPSASAATFLASAARHWKDSKCVSLLKKGTVCFRLVLLSWLQQDCLRIELRVKFRGLTH